MTKESVKTYLLTIAQVPVALMLLVVASIQLCCTYIEVRLKRLIMQPIAGLGEDEVGSFILWLSTKEADCIDWIRAVYEDNQSMREVVGKHPNTKLYAVLKPTKIENLQRIEWVLRAWPNDYSCWLIDAMGRSVIAFEHLRLSPLQKN